MLYEYFIITVIVAFIRKGSVSQLSATTLSQAYLFIVGFLFQVTAIMLYRYFEVGTIIFPYLVITSYILITYASWTNRNLPGLKLFGLGMLLNFLVIACNRGQMPVSFSALEQAGLQHYALQLSEHSSRHQLMNESTNLAFLGDILALRPPFVMSSVVVSLGDILVTIGISWFIYRKMLEGRL